MRLQIKHFLRRISCPVFNAYTGKTCIKAKQYEYDTFLYTFRPQRTLNMFKFYAHFYSAFLSIRHAHGDLCKHLGIDSSTDLNDRYSNLFLNAYINSHAHTEYLK